MSIIYTKNSNFLVPSRYPTDLYQKLSYGSTIEIQENFSSSVEFVFVPEDKKSYDRGEIFYLNNVLKNYKLYSNYYDPSYYSDVNVKMIKIPSIYFGSSIQKETLKLEVYYTGSLLGRLEDIGGNGELKQTYPIPQGNYDICGTVLYNHGVILLTGSKEFIGYEDDYQDIQTDEAYRWVYFGGSQAASKTKFNLEFNGTEIKPVITMNLPVEKDQANFSNNPTSFIPSASVSFKNYYKESFKTIPINTVSSSFTHDSASYDKQTFITKIGIYDKDKNLIGYAKLSKPVLKTEKREYNFKLKLDL